MRLPVTAAEMQESIQRIHLVLPRYQLTPETMPIVVRVYREALESFDGETVCGSVSLIIKTAEKFPTPNAWREACQTWLKHNRVFSERAPELDRDGNDIVCPVCRSVARWAILAMHATPFSVPMTTPRLDGKGNALPAGQTLRRIAVCDPERHHTGHGIQARPENFISWEN